MISIRDLKVAFEQRTLFSEVSADLEPGKFICLLGNNGCGKSTLLRTLFGENENYGGTITITDTDIRQLDRASMAREMALVLSGRTMIPTMMVTDVLATGRYPYMGWSGKMSEEDRQVVDEVITDFDLDELKSRYMDQLSDGEFQQVMIARSFVQSTPFIIMDEPSAFLDVLRKRRLFERLRNQSENKGILIATHDVHEALEFCTHVWLIDGGKLVEYKGEDPQLKAELNRIFAMKF